MQPLNRATAGRAQKYPTKILQFGAGNFLRAFVDWMIDILNDQTDFGGGVAVVKPTNRGNYQDLQDQQGLFHVDLNGTEAGILVSEQKLVSCINRVINPYQDWEQYLQLAEDPSVRFIISNTTEAGINFSEIDGKTDKPPNEFPAKLALWLFRRFTFFEGDPNRGCIVLPCELIPENGKALRLCILQYAKLWDLGDRFADWISNHNYFCDTLVDRIVSGYPSDRVDGIKKSLGFDDKMIVSGEKYHSWIIQGPDFLNDELPFGQTNLMVKFVNDLNPYREMKVRILNGAHTAMVPVGVLVGLETVGQVMEQSMTASFVDDLLADEIGPTLEAPQAEVGLFVNNTLDRFRNPYMQHKLMSIALNSVSKFRVRLLPTLENYHKVHRKLPRRIVFSLAALICMYRGHCGDLKIKLNDDPEVLSIFRRHWQDADSSETSVENMTGRILSEKSLWGLDLTQYPGLQELAVEYIMNIEDLGALGALDLLRIKRSGST